MTRFLRVDNTAVSKTQQLRDRTCLQGTFPRFFRITTDSSACAHLKFATGKLLTRSCFSSTVPDQRRRCPHGHTTSIPTAARCGAGYAGTAGRRKCPRGHFHSAWSLTTSLSMDVDVNKYVPLHPWPPPTAKRRYFVWRQTAVRNQWQWKDLTLANCTEARA